MAKRKEAISEKVREPKALPEKYISFLTEIPCADPQVKINAVHSNGGLQINAYNCSPDLDLLKVISLEDIKKAFAASNIYTNLNGLFSHGKLEKLYAKETTRQQRRAQPNFSHQHRWLLVETKKVEIAAPKEKTPKISPAEIVKAVTGNNNFGWRMILHSYYQDQGNLAIKTGLEQLKTTALTQSKELGFSATDVETFIGTFATSDTLNDLANLGVITIDDLRSLVLKTIQEAETTVEETLDFGLSAADSYNHDAFWPADYDENQVEADVRASNEAGIELAEKLAPLFADNNGFGYKLLQLAVDTGTEESAFFFMDLKRIFTSLSKKDREKLGFAYQDFEKFAQLFRASLVNDFDKAGVSTISDLYHVLKNHTNAQILALVDQDIQSKSEEARLKAENLPPTQQIAEKFPQFIELLKNEPILNSLNMLKLWFLLLENAGLAAEGSTGVSTKREDDTTIDLSLAKEKALRDLVFAIASENESLTVLDLLARLEGDSEVIKKEEVNPLKSIEWTNVRVQQIKGGGIKVIIKEITPTQRELLKSAIVKVHNFMTGTSVIHTRLEEDETSLTYFLEQNGLSYYENNIMVRIVGTQNQIDFKNKSLVSADYNPNVHSESQYLHDKGNNVFPEAIVMLDMHRDANSSNNILSVRKLGDEHIIQDVMLVGTNGIVRLTKDDFDHWNIELPSELITLNAKSQENPYLFIQIVKQNDDTNPNNVSIVTLCKISPKELVKFINSTDRAHSERMAKG